MQHIFSKIRAIAPKTALGAALLVSACAHALAAGPASFRPMQISIHSRVLSTGANFRQFGPSAIMGGGTCSATCCGPDGNGGTICASASAGMPSGYYPGPCIDLNAICSAEAAAVSGGGVTCTCGCSIACSDTGGPTGNLSGNGITTGAGGLANDFGTTRLAGPDEGLPTFTSHATTENQQWMEEAIRRQTDALQSLRHTPEPQSTLDYEARYLNRTTEAPNKPQTPSCPDDTSMVCLIGTTSQTPNMELLGENQKPGAEARAGDIPKSDIDGLVPAPDPASLQAAADGAGKTLSGIWDGITTATTYEEIVRTASEYGMAGLQKLGINLGNLSPELLEKLEGVSEKIGTAANVIGLADVAVTSYQGKTPEANAKAAALAVGVVAPPVGFAAAACGLSDACSQTVATGANAALNAPINAAVDSGLAQTFAASPSLDQYALMTGGPGVQEQVQAQADKMTNTNTGTVNSFVFDFLGNKSKENK